MELSRDWQPSQCSDVVRAQQNSQAIVLFLTKTLARNTKIGQIKMNVDYAGRASGLAFLWKKAEEFSLLGFHKTT